MKSPDVSEPCQHIGAGVRCQHCMPADADLLTAMFRLKIESDTGQPAPAEVLAFIDGRQDN